MPVILHCKKLLPYVSQTVILGPYKSVVLVLLLPHKFAHF
jgi:hypothetical protein